MSAKARGFAEELYPLRFGYNIAQVMLCSYMAIEALMIAYRQVQTSSGCLSLSPPFKIPFVSHALCLGCCLEGEGRVAHHRSTQ